MTIGVDTPDGRGRTALDQVGRDLTGNPRVRVCDVEVLSASWFVLRRNTYEYRHSNGRVSVEQRETYDRGNGAVVLLYNPLTRSVLLTRQFRFPVFVNGHPDGMLVEAAAGLLDDDDPETAVRREAEEETGHTIGEVHHLFDAFMSPGSVTERVHFFAARYGDESLTGPGGGLHEDGEDIEVLELPFDDALDMIYDGRICDAKTIMLLQWAALRGPFSQSSAAAVDTAAAAA